jgi:hypothetical protein
MKESVFFPCLPAYHYELSAPAAWNILNEEAALRLPLLQQAPLPQTIKKGGVAQDPGGDPTTSNARLDQAFARRWWGKRIRLNRRYR